MCRNMISRTPPSLRQTTARKNQPNHETQQKDNLHETLHPTHRRFQYPDFAAFQKAILANALTWKKNRLDYRSDLYKTQLTLFTDYSKPPEVNGVPINYSPAKCYDSPFIQGDWGSGVVTIRYGKDEQILNFNE